MEHGHIRITSVIYNLPKAQGVDVTSASGTSRRRLRSKSRSSSRSRSVEVEYLCMRLWLRTAGAIIIQRLSVNWMTKRQ